MRLASLGLAVAISIATLPAFSVDHRVQQSLAGGRNFVANEMLVQFKPGVSEVAKDRALARIGASRSETVTPAATSGHGALELARFPMGLSIASAMRGVEADESVAFAEPNWIYTKQVVSNDPYITSGQLWGMTGNYGSQASVAWGAGHTCSNADVYVGVIDEGLMYSHDDLALNAWTNPFDLPNNSVDDDGNGYVNDVHGWDFTKNDNSTFDGLDDDHGTHVSGTIAGHGGNGAGVAGVCWYAKLISAKFLGKAGGTTANAIKAVDYITDLKTRHGLNLVATNNSWGGGGYSKGLEDAIGRANTASILFVAAAGNDGANIDASASYPASYTNDNIISVAAIDSQGRLASFSNYGATRVDLGAPGVGIISTVPKRSGKAVVPGYASYSGTSMATPHVTGAAALYASTHAGATAAEIKAAILNGVTPTTSLAGKTVTGGRLNVGGF